MYILVLFLCTPYCDQFEVIEQELTYEECVEASDAKEFKSGQVYACMPVEPEVLKT